MRTSLTAIVIVGLLCAVPALSETVKGKATPTRSPSFQFPAAGQV